MTRAAAIFDLDRTVLGGSSTPAIQRHLNEAGLSSTSFPGEAIFQTVYKLFGESRAAMQAARTTSGVKPGWSVAEIAALGEKIADELIDHVMPFVLPLLEDHKAAGRVTVLATGSNQAPLQALADRLGFDELIATRWELADDGAAYTGSLLGERLLGKGKYRAVLDWAEENDVDLEQSYFYSDSRFDADLLSEVGHPVAVNPDPQLGVLARLRGWPVRHLDKPQGVAKILGREIQDWLKVVRPDPRLDLFANIEIEGIENIPADGPCLVVFNHRSYYDSVAVGYVLLASGRNPRFLGKREVFQPPVVGVIGQALGGIPVDRGTGSDEPLLKAAEALRGGEMIAMAPQGTIPRGPAFFDPELKGRWGAARLAKQTGAQVVPVGLWGTEKVWPRNSRVPIPRLGGDRPTVTIKVGPPFKVTSKDPEVGTKQIMRKIVEQLPPEAKQKKVPTDEELARTYPAGYEGDPEAEADRRPGVDTGKGKKK